MALAIERDPDPLRADEHGVARVCDSQVLLDVVIQQFNNGAEPEAIAQGFPTLALADVYGVIAYYLRYRPDVDAYITTRRHQAEIEGRFAQRQASPGGPKVEDLSLNATVGFKTLKHVVLQIGRERPVVVASLGMHRTPTTTLRAAFRQCVQAPAWCKTCSKVTC
jgi:uncharacterized protein (DUF433 family)